MTQLIERGRTAMARSFLSKPVELALRDGVLRPGNSFFDYGCGRGDDLKRLRTLDFEASGWDPAFRPNEPRVPADIVNFGYVANVIEDVAERTSTLKSAWQLARVALIVAVRLRWEKTGLSGYEHGDGLVTSRRTFQKFFTQEELRAWIDATLGVRSVAAAPGIFYVFRSSEDQQSFLAQRTRPMTGGIRVADALFDSHRKLLEPLQEFVQSERRLPEAHEVPVYADIETAFGTIQGAFSLIRRATGKSQWADVESPVRVSRSSQRFATHREVLEVLIAFVEGRGRLPRDGECPVVDDLTQAFGSVRAAFSLVRRVTGEARWRAIENSRKQDFLVYLALSAFAGRPRFSDLPADLQFDIRDFFGSFARATAEADKLLFAAGNPEMVDIACRESTLGKLTPEALYVHVSALELLSPVLRIYDGCARALTGTVDEATILKLNRLKPQVSYLSYPTFDRDPHPALSTVVIGRLARLDVTFRDFRDSDNPPILHRKETFVPTDYPARSKFERLTRQEERLRLLDESPTTIGTRQGWETLLARRGLVVKGHRVHTGKPPSG